MKHVTVTLLMAFSLCACTKEEVRLNVKLTATCRMCATEYKNFDGAVMRDTIIGLINHRWVDGFSVADTIPARATYNTVRLDGGELIFRACKLTKDRMHPDVVLTASGDIAPMSSGLKGSRCAGLVGYVRHQ